MDEIRKAPSSQQNSAIANARGTAVGRSHGVESFQNVDMALSFCMCVCVFSLAAAFLFRFVIFNPSLFRNSNLELYNVRNL